MGEWAIVLIVTMVFVMYFYAIYWAARDAEARGKNRLLVALLVALVQFPLGLILWLIFRPEIKQDTQTRATAGSGDTCLAGTDTTSKSRSRVSPR